VIVFVESQARRMIRQQLRLQEVDKILTKDIGD
jgi:hypothetical protein